MSARVLQVLGHSAGGIARHVAQVVEALDGSDGLTVDVACPPDLPIKMPKPAHDLVIPAGLGGHVGAIRSLRSIVGEGRYAIVHAHGLRAGIDSAWASRGYAPSITTVHNLVRSEIAGKRAVVDRWAEPLVVRLSKRTLAVSEEIASRLRQAAPSRADKIEVLYLGIGAAPSVRKSRSEVRAELGLAEGRHLAVAVARLAPQKALTVLFDAIASATAPMTLVVLGEGPLEGQLRSYVARKHGSEDIRFLGFRDDVADVVAAADVFCLSSIWEGVPLAAQEAVLLGTPVVSTDVGGMGELIVDRRSGRLVPPGDAITLAAAIDEVCLSEETRSSYVERARADLAERFSTERMLARLKELYSGGDLAR